LKPNHRLVGYDELASLGNSFRKPPFESYQKNVRPDDEKTDAASRAMAGLYDAVNAAHGGMSPRKPKPKNSPEPDWLPMQWTLEDDEAEQGEDDDSA
jgi:hypothetical protein